MTDIIFFWLLMLLGALLVVRGIPQMLTSVRVSRTDLEGSVVNIKLRYLNIIETAFGLTMVLAAFYIRS